MVLVPPSVGFPKSTSIVLGPPFGQSLVVYTEIPTSSNSYPWFFPRSRPPLFDRLGAFVFSC